MPLLIIRGRILDLTTELIRPLVSVVLIPKHHWETSEVLSIQGVDTVSLFFSQVALCFVIGAQTTSATSPFTPLMGRL